MTKFNLIKKITTWYGFEIKEGEKSLKSEKSEQTIHTSSKLSKMLSKLSVKS